MLYNVASCRLYINDARSHERPTGIVLTNETLRRVRISVVVEKQYLLHILCVCVCVCARARVCSLKWPLDD
jgi:hypothetical protein